MINLISITNANLYNVKNSDELKSYFDKLENPNKKKILSYLKNSSFESSCTTEKVFDYVEKKITDIPMVSYCDNKFYWDDREIYYFEKYNLKLNDDFIEYVLKRS